MSYGLRVWDAAGNLTLDVSDRLSRYFGSYSVTTNGHIDSQNISVPGIADDGTWAVRVSTGAFVEIFSGYLKVTQTASTATSETTTVYVFQL